MDNKLANYDPQRTPPRKKSDPDLVWNILTIVMLLGTLCIAGYAYSLFSNPFSELNFFPPDTPTVTSPPPTWTPRAFDATWTPTVTLQPSPSNTRRPTITLEPSNTPFSLATPTSEMSPTLTVKPTGAPYSAAISYHASTTFRSDTDCSKLWIAGHVKNEKNEAVDGLIVKMGGALPGKSFVPPTITLSGLMNKIYGASGFEFDLGVKPVASTQAVWVQLFSQSNEALSAQVFVTTYTDCGKNLAMVNFQKK